MKALIRLYGPPSLEAIHALERVAVESPHFCLTNPVILHGDPITQTADWVYNYFKERGKIEYERCGRLLASTKELEGHDFVFVWMVEPNVDGVNRLIESIDEALKLLGVLYTITIRR